ncbi:hypothetical protein AMECASPLE_004592 [Ameca splendens]|uniref:Secreted protein n=1 Tax=Ameca splendens TaxID=208324 RepID=A0ABV0YLI7_9TELE
MLKYSVIAYIAMTTYCSQTAVSTNFIGKLSERKRCGQVQLKNLERLTMLGLQLPHRCILHICYSFHVPCHVKEKMDCTVAQWSKILFSGESKLCISFGN